MALNKTMRAVLKALSGVGIDIKKAYKLQRGLIELKARSTLKPPYTTWDHQVRCGDHLVPVRIFLPKVEDSPEILLFFHGGGWVTESIDSYDKTCRNMARLTGCTVVSVDYRLAPEHPFPAGLEDCYAVAREIFLDHTLFDTDDDHITLIGDSAGGNLAAALSLLARDRGEFFPRRQILLYPATYNDHNPATSPFDSVRENGTEYLLTSQRVCDYMQLYSGAQSPKNLQNPYFAPLLAQDLTRQPATLVVTAQYDPLRDEGEAYGEKLRDAGNTVTIRRMRDALHGFFGLEPRQEHVRQCYEYINWFLKEGCGYEQQTRGRLEPPR